MVKLWRSAPSCGRIRIDMQEHAEHIRQQQTLSPDDFAAWAQERFATLVATDDAIREQFRRLRDEQQREVAEAVENRRIELIRLDSAVEQAQELLRQTEALLSGPPPTPPAPELEEPAPIYARPPLPDAGPGRLPSRTDRRRSAARR